MSHTCDESCTCDCVECKDQRRELGIEPTEPKEEPSLRSVLRHVLSSMELLISALRVADVPSFMLTDAQSEIDKAKEMLT